MSERAVLQAIESLTEEVRTGFGRLNGRVNAHERDLTRIKTLWSVAVVIGAWLFSKVGDALVAVVMGAMK
jgi:hypothetical protein